MKTARTLISGLQRVEQRKNRYLYGFMDAELVRAKPLHLLAQTALPLKSLTGAFIAAQTRTFLSPFFTGKEHSSQDGAKLLISVKKI